MIVNARQLKDIELSIEKINDVVVSNAKQRFKISEDKLSIKANQGHSIEIDLALTPSVPPAVLYHGTASRFLDAILQDGLKPMSRHHVHLSEDIDTALAVGKRYGKAVLLRIDTQQMSRGGRLFYMTENKVWLVDAVPAGFIRFDQVMEK